MSDAETDEFIDAVARAVGIAHEDARQLILRALDRALGEGDAP